MIMDRGCGSGLDVPADDLEKLGVPRGWKWKGKATMPEPRGAVEVAVAVAVAVAGDRRMGGSRGEARKGRYMPIPATSLLRCCPLFVTGTGCGSAVGEEATQPQL